MPVFNGLFRDAKSIPPSEIVSIKQIQNKIVKSKEAFLANASWDIKSHNVLDDTVKHWTVLTC